MPVGALAPAASSGLAAVAGPYQTLFANTTANLQVLGNTLLANPAPLLRQFVANQSGYAQTIAAGALGTLIDVPAVVTDAFLNGQSTLPVTFDLSGLPATSTSR